MGWREGCVSLERPFPDLDPASERCKQRNQRLQGQWLQTQRGLAAAERGCGWIDAGGREESGGIEWMSVIILHWRGLELQSGCGSYSTDEPKD